MRKKLLMKRAMTFSLMGVLAVSPVLVARANPGAIFSYRSSGGTQDTPDLPTEPNPTEPVEPTEPTNPDIPTEPTEPETPAVPNRPSGSGSSSNGGSITTNSSGTSTPTNTPTNSVTVGGTKKTSTVTGDYKARSVEGIVVATPYEKVAAALGVGANEKAFAVIEDSVCGEDSKACMRNKLAELKTVSPEVTSGPALDIWIGKSDVNGNFAKAGKAAQAIEFTVGIPDSFKTEGYEYALILVQEDGTTTVIPNIGDDPNTVTFATDVYGTFTLVKGPAGSFAAYR